MAKGDLDGVLRRSCVGVSRRFARKESKIAHFRGCTAPRDAGTLGAITQVGKGGELDEGNDPEHLRPPDVLELRDIDIPEIADDEVLVRVHAAGVGRDVWHVMTGLPYPLRIAGYGFRAPKNPVIGSDVAGVVEAVGKNVTRFQPGDEVFGIGKGSYA